jgi:multiple sugar transport system ATP-binding protein
MADIKLKNVSKKYCTGSGEIFAVSDFNLDIKSGESIVFVGPSGCGKTTTLRMIAGLETISEGELYIDGRLSNDVPPNERPLSMVFHDYAMFPGMTVYDNIAFGLLPHVLPEDEIKSKVYEIARILDIAHLLERKPAALSNGQKQRVALGRALIGDSKIVLLDEPLANLDEKLRFFMRTEFLKIHKIAAKTFIYVTHNAAEAMALGDRIVVMKDGIIQQVGTPKDLYFNPVNIFVAGFMGFPRMNFWKARLTGYDGSVFLNWNNNKVRLPCFNKDHRAYREYIGKDVYAAIRAENIHIDKANISRYKDSVIDAEVKTVEFYGLTTYIRIADGEPAEFSELNESNEFNVSIPDECSVKSGDKIKAAFNTDKIYLFDEDIENVINYRQ